MYELPLGRQNARNRTRNREIVERRSIIHSSALNSSARLATSVTALITTDFTQGTVRICLDRGDRGHRGLVGHRPRALKECTAAYRRQIIGVKPCQRFAVTAFRNAGSLSNKIASRDANSKASTLFPHGNDVEEKEPGGKSDALNRTGLQFSQPRSNSCAKLPVSAYTMLGHEGKSFSGVR